MKTYDFIVRNIPSVSWFSVINSDDCLRTSDDERWLWRVTKNKEDLWQRKHVTSWLLGVTYDQEDLSQRRRVTRHDARVVTGGLVRLPSWRHAEGACRRRGGRGTFSSTFLRCALLSPPSDDHSRSALTTLIHSLCYTRSWSPSALTHCLFSLCYTQYLNISGIPLKSTSVACLAIIWVLCSCYLPAHWYYSYVISSCCQCSDCFATLKTLLLRHC